MVVVVGPGCSSQWGTADWVGLTLRLSRLGERDDES